MNRHVVRFMREYIDRLAIGDTVEVVIKKVIA